MLWIHNGFNADPDPDSDPTFYANAFPDPGFDAHNFKIIQINTAQGSVVDPELEP